MAKFLASEIAITCDASAIGCLTSIEHNPATDKADMTTFSSAGRKEHMVVLRGDTFTLQGKADPADVGQIAVNLLGAETGADAEGTFVITVPGPDTYTFTGTAEVKLFGGGLTDGSNWSATIEVTGAIT